MEIEQITYMDKNHRELTYIIPSGSSLTRLNIYDEDMLLQFGDGLTPEDFVVLPRLRNSPVYVI